jgi:hypothetical protein
MEANLIPLLKVIKNSQVSILLIGIMIHQAVRAVVTQEDQAE